MGFIGRILGKIAFFLVLMKYFALPIHAEMMRPTYIQYVHEVQEKFIEDMRKFGYCCTMSGGSMPHDVAKLNLGFKIVQRGSIEEGREKIVFLTEKLLEAINNHEAIRPYLREYPFWESRVHVSLAFERPDGLYYKDGSITNVYCIRSEITYVTEDPNTEQQVDILKESYNEGLSKLNKPLRFSSKSTRTIVDGNVVPSKKRLAIMVTDLGGFTPERALEILGIKNLEGQKEFADELGELIGGVCDQYFDEEFLERLAQTVNKNQTGEYVDYWDNGQMKARIPYKKGTAEGHIHGWYPNGESAFKGYYKEGKRVGVQLARYPTGGIDPIGKLLEFDVEGKLHSEQLTFDISRPLLASFYYNHGTLHGDISFYSGKGNGISYGAWEYKNGKVEKIRIPPSKTGTKY